MEPLSKRREQLMTRLSALTLSEIGRQNGLKNNDNVLGDLSANAPFADAGTLPQAEPIEVEVALVQAALKRIEIGEYGFCTDCGAPIAEAQLDLAPEVSYCGACARIE